MVAADSPELARSELAEREIRCVAAAAATGVATGETGVCCHGVGSCDLRGGNDTGNGGSAGKGTSVARASVIESRRSVRFCRMLGISR